MPANCHDTRCVVSVTCRECLVDYTDLSPETCTAGPLMHLLLDLVPLSLPPGSAMALDPELRARAVRIFTLYSSDRRSLARAALKAAQVRALGPGAIPRPWPKP